MLKVLDALRKVSVIVYGIALQSGELAVMALINGKSVSSLRGQLVSTLLIFPLFVRSIMMKMTRRLEELLSNIRAVRADSLFPAKGRRTFIALNLKHHKSIEYELVQFQQVSRGK